ncbi:MAG: hypothetical protein M8866_11380 [marine benthic group bacterium]|nr:hypothetical protein [Candidatus Benthicola marisminoris]
MHLELSEVLACPACGPPQVMVAVVAEGHGTRVIHGFLGCPACDSRFPIRHGTVHLREGGDAERGESVSHPDLPDSPASLLGAVLSLGVGSGRLLLSPALAGIGRELAELVDRWEVVSLVHAAPAEEELHERLTRIVLPDDGRVPVLGGRFQAVALSGSPGPERLTQYAWALAPLGRLGVLAPGAIAPETLREAGLELVASDARVAVASRPS